VTNIIIYSLNYDEKSGLFFHFLFKLFVKSLSKLRINTDYSAKNCQKLLHHKMDIAHPV